MPNTLGLLRAVFPPWKFGMAVGIWAMVSSVSTALGPIVGGFLVQHVSWESVFYVNAPIGVAALAFSAAVLPQSRNEHAAQEKFDILGVALLALGLLALVFGVVKGETWGWASGGTLGAIALGALLLVLFGWWQTRVASPLLPMRLFRNPALTIGTVITALNFFVLLGVIFFVMIYLQNVRGFTLSRRVSAAFLSVWPRWSPRRWERPSRRGSAPASPCPWAWRCRPSRASPCSAGTRTAPTSSCGLPSSPSASASA